MIEFLIVKTNFYTQAAAKVYCDAAANPSTVWHWENEMGEADLRDKPQSDHPSTTVMLDNICRVHDKICNDSNITMSDL
jgi:hypothetical protein